MQVGRLAVNVPAEAFLKVSIHLIGMSVIQYLLNPPVNSLMTNSIVGESKEEDS